MHIISYSLTLIRRVRRPTLQADTYVLSVGVEGVVRIRIAIADACGRHDMKSWERSAAKHMRVMWMVDCKSLAEYLNNPTFTNCGDKRLDIEMAALRQARWLDEYGDPRDELTTSQSDSAR